MACSAVETLCIYIRHKINEDLVFKSLFGWLLNCSKAQWLSFLFRCPKYVGKMNFYREVSNERLDSAANDCTEIGESIKICLHWFASDKADHHKNPSIKAKSSYKYGVQHARKIPVMANALIKTSRSLAAFSLWATDITLGSRLEVAPADVKRESGWFALISSFETAI